jgi:periplasmic divalent cation tolerance protein
MKRANCYIVLVTAPDMKTARLLAKEILKARLAACANILPKIESHFWWQDKLNQCSEALILFKTTRQALNALEEKALSLHPYDTPEIVAVKLDSGTPRYLDWVQQNVAG